MRSATVVACSAALAVVAACDNTFEPLASGSAHVSVFGYLDASADTQWIRIMPIRPLLGTAPDSFPAIVTLENLGNGRVVQLRDSLFRFSSHLHEELGVDGIFLHNFWTTDRIEEGATYRLRITRPDEPAAEATIEIPHAFETEVWLSQVSFDTHYLRLIGVQHLPFVTSIVHYEDRCGSGIAYRTTRPSRQDGGTYMVPVRADTLPERTGCGRTSARRRDLMAVASAVPWPAGSAFSPFGLGVPDAPSNITNAVGFTGGVVTRVVPFESCTFEGPPPVPNHCVLRYNAEAAAMRGRVSEVRCMEGPLDSATVVLSEVDTQPRSRRKIRSTTTNRAGEYSIGALDAGVRYALRVRAKPQPDPFFGFVDNHTILIDTIQFAVGERRASDFALQRTTACGGAQQ